MSFKLSFILSVLATVTLCLSANTTFDWFGINPSDALVYTDCYDVLKCARLLVPLDWQDPGNNQTAAIAIVKLPATVSDSDPRFGGTIITNPGGPGASGVEFLVGYGRYIRGVVDNEKHYEILSFDPRGVFYSTPSANCYHEESDRAAVKFQQRGMGGLHEASLEGVRRQYAIANAVGILCTKLDGDGLNIRAFMSTASVARDMVQIIDSIQKLRSNEAADVDRLEAPQKPIHALTSGKAQIQFMGFSYGTYLGNTFASMFPDRVGRMILDGVVDSDDWTSGMWTKCLTDTENVVDYFYQTCFDSKTCKLKLSSHKNWRDIKKRVLELIKQVEKSPISFVDEDIVFVITALDIKEAFQIALYAPTALFEDLASELADLIEGNYATFIHHLLITSPSGICPLSGTGNDETKLQETYTWSWDAMLSVLCGDAEPIHFDATSFTEYIAKLRNQSAMTGGLWASLSLQCSGWQISPKWRFTGPFMSAGSADDKVDSGLETPLLFLSSKFDPVTPRENAYSMSARHPRSAVVVQDSIGHSALFSAPSECTWKVVRDYLETGKVPSSVTICHADESPFSATSSLQSHEWWLLMQWKAREARTRQRLPM